MIITTHTGKFVYVEAPQYLIAAKSYTLAAASSSSYAPDQSWEMLLGF